MLFMAEFVLADIIVDDFISDLLLNFSVVHLPRMRQKDCDFMGHIIMGYCWINCYAFHFALAACFRINYLTHIN